jgi:preprotein translocase subunit YajC
LHEDFLMFEHTVFLPLAQFNTTVSGAGSTTGPAVERPAAPGGGATPVTGAATGGAGANTVTSAPGSATSTAPGGDAAKPQSPFSFSSLIWIVLMFVALYFFLFRGQRKQEQKRKSMISELKKGDRVMTIGGMIARVVSIEGDEVVLKVDESANVKATYSKKAIQEVLDRDEKK